MKINNEFLNRDKVPYYNLIIRLIMIALSILACFLYYKLFSAVSYTVTSDNLLFQNIDYADTNRMQTGSSAWVDIKDGTFYFVTNGKDFDENNYNNHKCFIIKDGNMIFDRDIDDYYDLFQSNSRLISGQRKIGDYEYYIDNKKQAGKLYLISGDELVEVNFRDYIHYSGFLASEQLDSYYNFYSFYNYLLIEDCLQQELLILDDTGSINCLYDYSDKRIYSTFAADPDYIFFSIEDLTDNHYSSIISGLYRVDLSDYSTKKISNTYYDGLYLFGDGYIYVTDKDSSIYRMDYDGKKIDIIYKVTRKWLPRRKFDLYEIY